MSNAPATTRLRAQLRIRIDPHGTTFRERSRAPCAPPYRATAVVLDGATAGVWDFVQRDELLHAHLRQLVREHPGPMDAINLVRNQFTPAVRCDWLDLVRLLSD
jgi:hypothetical protein